MQRAVETACGSVESLSALLELIDDAVVMVDLDGRVSGWSRGAEHLLGYSAAEALGKDCAEIYAEDERAAHRDLCRRVALGTTPAGLDATIQMQSGEHRSVHIEFALMHDVHGAPICILSNIRSGHASVRRPDVTRSETRELWTLLDSAPIAFSHLDANRRFLYVNKASLRNMQEYGKDVIGRHLRDVFGEQTYKLLLPQVDTVLAGTESHSEVTMTDPLGQTRHFYRHLYPDLGPDGAVRGYFSAILDITAAKVTQESQLRREHILRSALVREINHRIKNSLQGLIGMMRLSSAREVSSAAAIDQCVSQLMAVAVAFGLASRHGEAQILLCDMVLDIAHNVEQVSQRRIQVELSPAAVRQPVALSERHGANISLVINELIFNAIKHSAGIDGPRGIRVAVDRDESSATFSVSNEAGRLPEGFSLADGSGLGTGLSLIKVLVPAESCDLVIEPGNPGVSARLTLRAPVLSLS